MEKSLGECERCEKERLLTRYVLWHDPNHSEFRSFCASCRRSLNGKGWKKVKAGHYEVTQTGDATTPFILTRRGKSAVPKAVPQQPPIVTLTFKGPSIRDLPFEIALSLVRRGFKACRPIHRELGQLLIMDLSGLRFVKHFRADQYCEVGGQLLMRDLVATDWVVYP